MNSGLWELDGPERVGVIKRQQLESTVVRSCRSIGASTFSRTLASTEVRVLELPPNPERGGGAGRCVGLAASARRCLSGKGPTTRGRVKRKTPEGVSLVFTCNCLVLVFTSCQRFLCSPPDLLPSFVAQPSRTSAKRAPSRSLPESVSEASLAPMSREPVAREREPDIMG